MRLQKLLTPQTIGISANTYHLVRGHFVCQTLGDQTLLCPAGPLHLYQVFRQHQVRSRFETTLITRGLTPLVGRESELDLLLGQWGRAREGIGAGICISGEAGMGKSRLAQAFKDELGASAYTLLEGQSSPYHQRTAFWPLIAIFEQLCEWEPHETSDIKVKKLEIMLSQLTLPRRETLALFANLLSLTASDDDEALRQLSAQQRRRRFTDVFLMMLLELAEQQPILLVIEDLHWADTLTLELLDLLMNHISSMRMLVLLLCRSDATHPLKTRADTTHLALGTLTNEQTERMILQLTGGKQLPQEVMQQLVAKTDGLPLFVEEMTQMVLNSGDIREGDKSYELTTDVPSLAIPDTLQDSLMARLDRLARGQETVKWAAAIGRAFSYDLIRAVVAVDESTLQQDLLELTQAALLHPYGLPTGSHYRFKHALIQDTAYQSIPRPTRREHHQRIAHVLEQAFPETATTQPERLAYHYTEAGLSQKSVMYWQQAGQQALDRNAFSDAVSHAQQGLLALSELPEDDERRQHELDFQILLCKASDQSSKFGHLERNRAYRRAYELCEAIGHVTQRFDVLGGLGHWYLQRAELASALEIGEQLLLLARGENDAILLRKAHRDVATVQFFLGVQTDAMKHIQQALPANLEQMPVRLTVQHNHIAETALFRYQAWAKHLVGYPEQAFRLIEHALYLSQQNQLSFGLDLLFKLTLHQWRREPEAIDMHIDTVIDLAQRNKFAIMEARGRILKGWSLANQGEQVVGIELIRRGIADYQATGNQVFLPYFMSLLVDIYGRAEEIDTGLRILSETLALVEKTGERCWESELYRLRGELLLRQTSTNVAEAEEALQQALRVARQQRVRMLELRATTHLSRLWHRQGKRHQALNQLRSLYGWFTEGHDTADLQDAKTCLDELT